MTRLAAAAAAVTLAAFAVSCAPPAHAQPVNASAVCARVAMVPTIGGVVSAVIDLADQAGISEERAGSVVAHAILDQCPGYSALLQRIVDRYASGGMVA